MRGRRALSWLLTLTLMMGLMTWSAPEAEAASDEYKGWTQEDARWGRVVLGPPDKTYPGPTDNDIPYMKLIGCTTVALTKIMIQAGCEDQSTFNPKILAQRIGAYGSNGLSGYVNLWQDGQASAWGSLRDFVRPANEVPNFQYVDAVTLTNEGILSSAKNGYYMVVQVINPLGSYHWVAIDNELTLKNNTVMIMDTGNPGNGVYNISLASRYPQSGYLVVRYKTTCPNHGVSNGKYVEGEGLRCKGCNALFPITDTYQLKNGISATVTAATGYLRTMPYEAAAQNKTVSKGTKVVVVGRAKNAYGNLWFKLSDGSWMVGDKLALENGTRIGITDGTTVPICLNIGEAFEMGGYVVSLTDSDLRTVKIGVKMADNATWTGQVQTRTADGAAYNIADVNLNISFGALSAGDYHYCIEVTDGEGVTQTLSYPFVIKGHTHSYSAGVESAHPHREYQKCACGNSYYTGVTVYREDCEVCNPKGPYTVSFHANGGVLENAESKKLNPGDRYGLLPVPTRDDSSGNDIFRGWSTDVAGTHLVGDLDVFAAEENQVLYAQWNINIRETYLIEDEGEVVKAYTPVAYAVSREQARRICEAGGGNLLDVRTEIDEAYLDIVCAYPDEELWVGLSRDAHGNWAWDTGTILREDIPWGENQPVDGDAVYYDTSSRTFHTADGNDEARYFIYEYGRDEIPTSLAVKKQTGSDGEVSLRVDVDALEEDGCLFVALYDETGLFLKSIRQDVKAHESQTEIPLALPKGVANAKVMLLDESYVPLTEEVPIHIDESCWSVWQENCDVDASVYEIEERTLYRSRAVETKEYEDTVMDGTYDPGEGWTMVDQDMILDWTEGLTTTVKPQEAWDLKITGSRTVYKYQHWHNTYDGTNLNIDSIAYGSNCVQCTFSAAAKLTQTFPALTDRGGKTAYTSGQYCGNSVSRRWWFENGTETEYTYSKAELVGVRNYYERYGKWSAWQEIPVAEKDGLAVERRTEYRWKLRAE